MKPQEELASSDLRRKCEFAGVDFETTDDLPDLPGLLGQPRAVEAVEFGLAMEREGYNVFAFGPDGTGKRSAVREMLARSAAGRPTPPDLCYVHSFARPQQPRLIELPPGKGHDLSRAMEHLAEELSRALQTALESDAYQARRKKLEERLEERQSKALGELSQEASKSGLAMVQTPVGILFAPRHGDEVLSAEELVKLPESEQQELEQQVDVMKDKLQTLLRRFSRWRRRKRDEVRKLNREVGRFAVGPLLEEIREDFEDHERIQEYLDAVEKDIVENLEQLAAQRKPEVADSLQELAGQEGPNALYKRYRVNLLVDHGKTEGAPIVYEDNPTYQNLVGRVEHVSTMGTLVTDFTLIKPGALHRANGGYLVLDAHKLLQHPYAWDGLKRTLRAGRIRIEGLGEALSLISTYSLQPEPAQLAVKIVLLGSPWIYYLVSRVDPDFRELFKVSADFAEELDWSPENTRSYANLVAKLARGKQLRPFSRAAVARLIEQGSREVADSRKLSLYMGRVLDLMREADHWAGTAGAATVQPEHVQRAVDARIFRADRLRERVQEEIRRGTLLIDTDGAKVGQVNGLSVLALDDFAFGRPSRITARVRLGKGEVVDIEREVELSGPIHSKGVLILSGFLGSRFAADRPLSLSASLVFEQSYGGVDGDSASSAELYALLSAIAGVPIRQDLAVTGSVNQQGEIQAIGGVNEKIEGFFDVCAARGLTGEQGVLIPVANVEHLMLRQDVIDAVEGRRFHIYPVTHIDQGLERLTGLPAGEPDGDGEYPEGTVNARVVARLTALADRAREHASPAVGAAEPAR